MKLDPIPAVLDAVSAGKPVVILDDESRENEADLMVAAELITPETLAFMICEGRTVLCLAMTEQRLEELGVPLQKRDNSSPFTPHFGVGFDHRSVQGVGIGAQARATTIREAVAQTVAAEDFVVPGHVFPLAAIPGGVLKRRGHTEAAIDLATLAGCRPAGVICELMDERGEMLRGAAVEAFCQHHDLRLTSVEAIVEHRLQHEVSLRRVAALSVGDEMLFTRSKRVQEKCASFNGEISIIVYHDDVDGQEHFAIMVGAPKDGTLVRIHSECLTGDVFRSERCDCGDQLDEALLHMFEEGSGVLVYLNQEGRGIGLANKMRAYALQDEGLDTVEANEHLGFEPDARDYRAGANILRDLGLQQVRLLTNNPDKLNSLSQFGIQEIERVSLAIAANPYNEKYLATKRDRMGHLLPSDS